jgi:hypothetical protein
VDDAPRLDGTAIVVNHDSGERLGPLLDALLREVPSVVVVDNDSRDGSLSPAEDREGVRVLRNDRNLGFAAAANMGAREGTGRWLVFVNPDVHLQPGDVRRLVADLPDRVAEVAPLQVDERGRPRAETGGYDATLGRYAVWALVPARFHRRLGPWLAPPFPERDTDLDWVSGALAAVRRDAFERLGGFDERYFLYHEDVAFGRRLRRAGYRVRCRPSVRLHHEVAHGEPERRVTYTLRALASLARDPNFDGWRRRGLGVVLWVGFGLRSLLGSGPTRRRARAALPVAWGLVLGHLPDPLGPAQVR